MSQQSNRGKLIEAYLEKHLTDLNREENLLGLKTLARMFLRDYVELFDYNEAEIESVRNAMRHYLGRNGKSTTKKRFDIRDRDTGETQPSMPESEIKEKQPYWIKPGTLGVLSDVHVPYHEPHVIAKACQYFKEKGVDQILLNGDILDFWGISKFIKLGQKPDTVEELKRGREFLAWLRFQFKDIPIYYRLGNHENRWAHYLWSKGGEIAKAMQLMFGPGMGLPQFLHFEEHGIEFVDAHIVKAGRLNILHGHEFGGGFFNPVNAARGAFLRGKSNILVGHHHATSEHQESNLEGDQIAAWSTGCLCELRPEYAPVSTKTNWGAAVVTHEEDGSFYVDNFRIWRDKKSGEYRIG